MNARPLRRALCLTLILIAPACELQPSRPFAPPTTVTSGPPARAFGSRGDREAALEPADEAPPAPPSVWDAHAQDPVIVRRLQNGMVLHALPRSDLPTATVLLVLGTRAIPAPFPVAMLYAGTALGGRAMTWSRVELDGGRLFAIGEADYVAIGLTSLAPVLEPVLARRVPEIVTAALWPGDVDLTRESIISGIGNDPPGRRADALAFAALFPSPHPYEWAGERGIPERYREVKVGTVHAFRDANLTADNMMVVASGNVNVDTLVATLDRALAQLPRKPMTPSMLAPARPSCTGQVLVAHDAGSQQASVLVAYPAPPAKHVDTPALAVLATAAGGSISTHLNGELRKQRGLSYGLFAELQGMREGGVLAVRGDLDPTRIVEGLRALDDELRALEQTPLGEEELRVAKMIAAHRAARAGGATTAARLARASILGLPIFDASAINAVTAEQLRATAERYLQASKRCIVVVGNADQLERDLHSAGLGTVSRVK